MNFYKLMLTIFLATLLLPMVSATVISYDDGTAETFLTGASNRDSIVRITPERNGVLEGVSAYVSRPYGNWSGYYAVYGLDNSHNPVNWLPASSAPSSPTFKITSFISPSTHSTDFYVGVQKLSMPSIGSDQSNIDNRSEYNPLNNFNISGPYVADSFNDYMIRANFNYFPTVSNATVIPTPTNNLFPILTATCTDYENQVSSAYYRVNSGSWIIMASSDGSFNSLIEDVTATINVSGLGLANGNHTVEVACGDADGYYSDVFDTTSFFIDTVKPTVSYSLNPSATNGSNGWYISPVEVTLSAADSAPSSGIKHIKYRYKHIGISGFTPWTTYTGPITISADGTHKIRFRAVDNAGNISNKTNILFSIDSTSPSAPTLDAFPYDYLNGTSETVSWTASTDGLVAISSGINYYKIYRDINGGGFSFYDTNVATWYIDTGLINNTEYSYYITAVDYAGNESSISNQDSFAIDMSAPEIPFLNALPSYTGNSTVTLNWNKVDDNPSTYPAGVDFYNPYKNGVDIANVNYTGAPTQTYNDTGNSDGATHQYEISATDASEPTPNESALSNTENTTIDISAPITTATLDPAIPDGNNGWYINPVEFTLSATDSLSGVAATYYCIDTTGTCIPTTNYTSPFDVSTEDKNVNVRYYSIDNVGNVELVQSIVLKIDLTNPYNQSILLDNGATYNTTGSVMADPLNSGLDATSGLNYCEVSWDNGSTWENSGLALIWGPHAYVDGTQIAQYQCTDIAGNTSGTTTDSIIVDTTPPISAIITPFNMDHHIKGKLLLKGTAFDATSGVDFVEIKIKHRNQTDDGWELVQNWTLADGNTNWEYLWDNSSETPGLYKVISRATDNAGWEEAENEKLRIQLMENPNPQMDNIYYESSGIKYNLVQGSLDRSNTSFDLEIFDLTQGLYSTTMYNFNVDTDNNAFFNEVIDVNAWDRTIFYGGRIELVNGEIVYTQFDTMAIVYLSERIDYSQQLIQILNQTVIDLNSTDVNLQNQINDLNTQINDLNAQIQVHDANITLLWSEFGLVWSELSNIKNTIDEMNHGTISIVFDRNNNNGWLRVKGEAPIGTAKAIIHIRNLDRDEINSLQKTITVNSDKEYKYDYTNVNNWGAQIYDVAVEFVDSSNTTIGQWVNEQLYALEYLAEFQGFNRQNDWAKDYCYARVNYLPISFGFGAVETGIYDFNIIATDGLLTTNTYLFANSIDKYVSRKFNGITDFDLPYDAEWKIKLVASKNGSIVAESNEYTISLMDDCSLFTQGISYQLPIVNSDTNKPYPIGSYKSNVFWTKSGEFDINAYLMSNNKILGKTCDFKYRNATNEPIGIANELDVITIDNQNGACNGKGNTTWWNNTNFQDNSTKLSIYALFAGEQMFNTIEIGIDDIKPSINSITPDEDGIMNGMYTWFADITDNLSGITRADFSLIEKNGGTYCYDTNCHTGNGTVAWIQTHVNFDTNTNRFYYDLNTLKYPDGDYNVMFEAWDIAGNYDFNMLDPKLDNTPPKINSINVTNNPVLRGNQFLVDVDATDNLTGVNTVLATVNKGAINETIVLTPNGGLYSGIFTTDMNWSIGEYTLNIDVNDNAGNNSNGNTDFNVFENYLFNLSLDSTPKIKGATGIISGQLVSDTGRKVNDENVTIDSLFFGPVIILTDVNGFFEQGFTTTTADTFDITVDYSDVNTNYSDSIVLVVNNPAAPPTEPETPPQGGGGGGGGGGSPSSSALLRVSPLTIELNEEVDVSALCKWSFGCRLKINGNTIAEMVRVGGFQEYPQTFTSAGEYTIGLYHKGTIDTLVAEKIVTVNAEEVQVPVVEEEKPVLTNTETQPNNPNPIEEPATPEPPKEEENIPPTGFFGLADYDFGSLGGMLGAILVLLLLGAGTIFVIQRKK